MSVWCRACGDTKFSGVGAFDLHRSQRGERGACLDPATLPGLAWRDDQWCSATEMDALAKAKLRRRR